MISGTGATSVCLNEYHRQPDVGNSVWEVIKLLDDPSDPFDPVRSLRRGPVRTDTRHQERLGEAHDEEERYAPVWEIGSKAHGLLFIANMEGVNAPPGHHTLLGAVQAPGRCHHKRRRVAQADDISSEALYRQVHRQPLRQRRNPQLLSVRSGAVFSMPGCHGHHHQRRA